ncbi:MAG: sulfocyanin-like copper-binding protein [Gemmatimonadota bacterium]
MRNQLLLGIAGLLGLLGCSDSFAEFQACIDSVGITGYVDVTYDRFADSTHVVTAGSNRVTVDRLRLILESPRRWGLRETRSELGPPTLTAFSSCGGSGTCRPDSIQLSVAQVSREAEWEGEDTMIFLHSNGDRMQVSIHADQVAREPVGGVRGTVGIEERVEFKISYRDFLTMACDDHTEFRLYGSEGAVEHASFRALARVLERGEVPVTVSEEVAPGVDLPMETSPATGDEELPLMIPDWYQLDRASRTVAVRIEAGSNSDNNFWNFNGYYGGRGEVVIPQGYTVTVRFRNLDPNMAHSIGIGARRPSYPATFSDPVPVFSGGITSNPTSMTRATMPGEEETITFVAAEAGLYDFICYVAGHAVVGMTLPVVVSEEGQAGFRE